MKKSASVLLSKMTKKRQSCGVCVIVIITIYNYNKQLNLLNFTSQIIYLRI